MWDPTLYGPTKGGQRRASLEHRNKVAARAYATAQAAKLEQGSCELMTGRVTMARVLADSAPTTARTRRRGAAGGRATCGAVG